MRACVCVSVCVSVCISKVNENGIGTVIENVCCVCICVCVLCVVCVRVCVCVRVYARRLVGVVCVMVTGALGAWHRCTHNHTCTHTHTHTQPQDYELPYPLQKADGDTEDAWALKDASDATVLKLRFVLA